ncbi:MAG: 30S ribosome-binding factor RbfA [Marinobacter sp.]|uniref:30S ribosome-binding factor RbfA n=1 Tax=Marinobacter sp. TaxID=50741 RepID=UPI001B3E77C4|nr:30S ribosome-binding factor RbfA [Marinobacter sp.]MBQ0746790.1 30S ribosome-binding factor RbfA [Marinobacter sp.]MBQ0813490.1 30S ribosome-binding factor RbfA [Marinobacter sp.]|tara:strand:+ start:11236 stop:11694 length:459 start_codon:yes stop_codon:yes gene_type:complete
MPREFSRIDRIGDQMQRELAQLIQREVKDPRLGMVTVNAVKVSRDLGYADIYVSLLTTEELTAESPEVKDSISVLNRAAGFLRGQVGRAMKLRVIPQLRFHFDALQGYSRRMDSLIREAVGDKTPVERNDDSRGENQSENQSDNQSNPESNP